ncbi:MAG TPA: LamG-like jellyroll fold domain-containing protein [Verrucomicrobiae bacterium]|nr:LamG-like jellyroll fold domain-containing protein [Verrucomicrobiae bacterium]
MYLFKIKKSRRESSLIGTLHSFLLMLAGLLVVNAVEAQSYNWKSVVIKGGGFVTGIVPHPNASGLMYCRTDVGGAYRWNATDGSWIPLQDYLGYPNEEWSLDGVESIALDPQDTNRLYMTCGWLGVGRPNAVLISTNQGASFTRVNTSFTMEANSDGRGNGERLAVDPNLGSILFNGTRYDGLWKSVNYGASWSKVTSFPVNTTANNVGLVFVEFIKSSGVNGSATPVIFVGVSQGGTNIYRSTDGGTTWTGITNGAAANFMPHRPAQDGLGNMYITFCDGPGPNNVGAGSVRKFNLTTLASIDVTPPTGQGGFAGVSVDKQNPNRLVVSTVDRWWPSDEVYRSTNGGTNWTELYTGATIDASSAPWIAYHAANPPVPHWIADIKIDPFNSNRVYHVSGGGIYSSYNLTATTPSWQFRSDGIEEMGLWGGGSSLSSPPSGPLIFTALGDIGGFAHYNPDVSPPETNHFNPAYTSNTSVDFAELNPSIVVRTHYGAPRGSRSTNAGRAWTDFPTHPTATDTNGGGVIAISADGGRLVWAPYGAPASYSTDNGASWNACGGSLTPTYWWEQPLLFSDRVNSNKFYLYMPSTGKVHISTDGGANFSAGPTIGFWGDGIRTVYGYEGHVWMACEDGNSANAGLWRSTNSGASFTKLGGVQNAKSLGFGRTATGTGYPVIYLSGQVSNTWGIFRSENQGTNWIRINDNQHQYGSISLITGDPKIYGRCYFGGRGLLYGDIPNIAPAAPDGLVAISGNTQIALTWSASSGADSCLVKRATVSGGTYTNIASGLTATSFTDTGLMNGTTYYYVVTATNVYGVSPDSTEASATPSDTRALYAFEGNAQDSSGGGNHGTANALSYVAGKVGSQAAQFDGTSSYVSIPRSVTDDFTVAMWVKTTGTAGTAGAQWWSGKGLMDGEVSGGGADWGTAIVNGKFVLGVGSSGGDTTIASSVNINDGTWHHVAATRNNTNGATAVYVDGVLRGSGTGPTGSRIWPPNLHIGNLQTGNNFLNGTLDDVRLYDRILTTNEITALISPPAAPTGLAALAGDGSVTLSWSASPNATSYFVKRSTTSGTGYTGIATNANLTFTNTSLANGTLYFFVVSATNSFGESPNSAQVGARPTSFAPVAIGMSIASGQLQFSWPTDHTGWILQSQTNDLASGLGTNWVSISNSDQTNLMAVPMSTTNGAVFFRLLRP